MSLPNHDVEWPPRDLKPILNQLEEWDAWYSGDPQRLHAYYAANVARWSPRPVQYAGGVGGWLARLWWGRPAMTGEPPDKLHIPVAADLATTSADLLFSEPPKVVTDDTDTTAWLEQAGDQFQAALLCAADVQAALGGVYLRVVWDRDVSDRPWIASVHADAAVPEWRYDQLYAVTFWRELQTDGQQVMRHLERHEPGGIIHGLYVGGLTSLGRRVPLTEHPETAGLAAQVTVDGDTIETGTQLTAAYVPNQMPSRRWRATPAGANLGRSDYEGVEPLMDKLDFVWSAWMRDIDLAKGRLIVPSYMLQSQGPGGGATFDVDQRLFTPVHDLPGQSGSGAGITVSQFAIRVEEHSRSANELLEQILRDAGYSQQTFGIAGEAAATATEIQSRERRSLVTRAKKALYWRPGLSSVIAAQLEIARAVFRAKVTPQPPKITFADSVQEDRQRLATTADLLRRAEAASTETLVQLINPDWDGPQVEKEVTRIQAETGRQVQDPSTFTGG